MKRPFILSTSGLIVLCAACVTASDEKAAAIKKFPYLKTDFFIAYIADNSALGIHHRGYNGVASLIPRHSGNNLFVPTYSGLNYETIELTGLPARPAVGLEKFEPRWDPMYIQSADEKSVTLVQPETSRGHVSAKITFSVEEPYYLHQHIELTFHKRFCDADQKSEFQSTWASYMLMPSDPHVYLKAGLNSDALSGWVGVTKEKHGSTELVVRPLPADRQISAAEHLEIMKTKPPMSDKDLAKSGWPRQSLPRNHKGPLSFYYGLYQDSLLFLMMFKQPERFYLTYSPSGGGRYRVNNPAWDYTLHLDDAEVGHTYTWDLCLVVKPFKGRKDVLDEVRRYQGK
jgi:hypothetical protein